MIAAAMEEYLPELCSKIIPYRDFKNISNKAFRQGHFISYSVENLALISLYKCLMKFLIDTLPKSLNISELIKSCL